VIYPVQVVLDDQQLAMPEQAELKGVPELAEEASGSPGLPSTPEVLQGPADPRLRHAKRFPGTSV
jgi:hypothetical protein